MSCPVKMDRRMKLLVFAHSPPPHHGQSYMVELLLKGLAGEGADFSIGNSVECFQVNCRFSDTMEDIGEMHWSKPWLLLRYCAEALWHRVRHGADHFYYVPAPGKRVDPVSLYPEQSGNSPCPTFARLFGRIEGRRKILGDPRS